MSGINHLVLAGHDLEAMRRVYASLGFTLAPSGQHPFGTGNTVIQLHGGYLELLAVTRPQDVVEPRGNAFSFSAFNRDYLARHEGFSMLVLDSKDARNDRERWASAGLKVFDPFTFERPAMLPSGEEIVIGFALAQTAIAQAPWLGVFACQHFRPDYYAQPQFLQHDNGARRIADVWVTGEGAVELVPFFETFTGTAASREGGGPSTVRTDAGAIVIAPPAAFEAAFGEPPPHPEDGAHLGAFTVACSSEGLAALRGRKAVGERIIVPSREGFGTVIAFMEDR
jgi:hypothetical protein